MPENNQWWQQALNAVPVIGPVIAGAIQGGQNRRAIERQNEYNSPVNALQRIREAGLPYAAMTNNISGNQSSPAVVPDTGVQGGIQNYIQTTQQRKALELMDVQIDLERQKNETEKAETRKRWADALMSDTAARLATDRAQFELNKTPLAQISPIDMDYSIGNRQQIREQDIRQAELDRQNLSNDIERIQLQVQQDLQKDGVLSATARQQLSNLVSQSSLIKAQTKLTGQQYEISEMQRKVEQTLINALEGSDGKIDVGRAFIHALLSGSLGANKMTGR